MPDTAASQRRPPPPFALTVITGFLGAGKTTLLNRLLRDPQLAETLVIINEFGEIGLDHLLVEASDNDMILMSSGCLCCSIRGDLVTTLEDVLRRTDNGRMPPFRRVVIETTGLADPVPVLQTILQHPYLRMRFCLQGVVTLVDAINGEATLNTQEEAVKQVAVADRLVLTKTDLSDDAGRQASGARLRQRLLALNPAAPLLDAARGEATAAALLDCGLYDPDGKTADVRQWLGAEAFDAPHDRADSAATTHVDEPAPHSPHTRQPHGHDVNRHDARIRAFCLTSKTPMRHAGFGLFLELLQQAHGPKLLRVKGIVCLDDDVTRPVVIHGVQHVFHPPVRLEKWPDADTRTRIIFILRDLAPAFVEDLWRAFAGEVAIDRPDAAALLANPLKPVSGGLLG